MGLRLSLPWAPVSPKIDGVIATINPATNQTLRVFDPLSLAELDQRIGRAWTAFLTHRKTSFAERAGWMTRAAEILGSEKQRLGELMTLEMGKPLRPAIEEAVKCATACRYYAENAERISGRSSDRDRRRRQLIRYQPIGAVLAVMPWNFPVLAGVPFPRAGPDGGQCGVAETCVERAAVRA